MNQSAVTLVANALPKGLIHPGQNGRPTPVQLPGFNTTGMTDEQAQEFIGGAATLLAESIVALLEQDFEIVTKHDMAQLREDAATAPDGTRIISVREVSETGPELMQLTVGKADTVALSTPGLKALAKRFEKGI